MINKENSDSIKFNLKMDNNLLHIFSVFFKGYMRTKARWMWMNRIIATEIHNNQ